MSIITNLILLSSIAHVYCRFTMGRHESNDTWGVFKTPILTNKLYASVVVTSPNEVIAYYGSYGESEPSSAKGLSLGYSTVYYIPEGIDVFFPQLEALSVAHCELMEITKDNLSQMPKLRLLDASYNKLKYLAGNLFESTPQMEQIDLSENPIISIGNNLLAPLTKLTHARFRKTCAKYDITPEMPNREKLEYRIKENCKTTDDLIMLKLAEVLAKTEQIREKIDENQQLMIVKQETLETKLKKIEDIVGRLN